MGRVSPTGRPFNLWAIDPSSGLGRIPFGRGYLPALSIMHSHRNGRGPMAYRCQIREPGNQEISQRRTGKRRLALRPEMAYPTRSITLVKLMNPRYPNQDAIYSYSAHTPGQMPPARARRAPPFVVPGVRITSPISHNGTGPPRRGFYGEFRRYYSNDATAALS